MLNMSGPWEVVNMYTCGYGDVTRNAVLLNSGDINLKTERLNLYKINFKM